MEPHNEQTYTREELEAKVKDFPPGAVEEYCSEKASIDKYKLIGGVTVDEFRSEGVRFVDIDPAKLDYKEWVDDKGARYYATVLKGTEIQQGITRIITKHGYIKEHQTLNGKTHGYSQSIWDSGVHMFGCYDNGKMIGRHYIYHANNEYDESVDYGGKYNELLYGGDSLF